MIRDPKISKRKQESLDAELEKRDALLWALKEAIPNFYDIKLDFLGKQLVMVPEKSPSQDPHDVDANSNLIWRSSRASKWRFLTPRAFTKLRKHDHLEFGLHHVELRVLEDLVAFLFSHDVGLHDNWCSLSEELQQKFSCIEDIYMKFKLMSGLTAKRGDPDKW